MIYVFLGGGLGSVLRYAFSLWFSSEGTSLPWQTVLANLVSSILLGYFWALSRKCHLDPEWSLLIMTGFCGGFSTFSTFSLENLQLLLDGNYLMAVLYILLSVMICILGAWLGMRIAG